MDQAICHNPDCKKTYNVTDKDADALFCSFQCWEAVNCKAPYIPEFEKIEIEDL
jgi:hypothetical protein